MSDLTPDARAVEVLADKLNDGTRPYNIYLDAARDHLMAAYAADAGLAALLQWCLELEQSAAIHRRDALAFKGERDRLAAQSQARMEYLFHALPFSERHRWGGDVREFIEGIDFAIAALRATAPTPVSMGFQVDALDGSDQP